MASDARSRSPQDGARRRREFNRSPYVTLGAVRYAVRRAPPPSRTCPCRCCTSEDLLAACLGRTAPPDRRRTLERLQRFRFGRGASGERERRAGSADRPRPDRTERLRELTERLRGGSRITASSLPEEPHSAPVLPPVPPPRSRHSRASPAREPSLCCAIPPSNPRAKTDDRTSEDERDSGTREDFFDADDIRLVKVEPRSIVGSYAQKTIPFRSASFSQGDFASEKYYRGTGRQPSIFDFGRRPTSKSADSTGVRVECVTNEPATPRDVESSSLATEETVTEGGSTASVDSAVGSDEGLLAQVSPVPRSPPADGLHKQLGSRSLTHPLPRRGGSQERTGPGGSLQFLATSRVLHEVREESDASLADSAQPHSEGVSPLEPAPAFDFPPPAEAPPCANVDCECSSARVLVSNREGEMRTAIACAIPVPVYECIVKEWSTSIDRSDGGSPSDASLAGEKEDEPITSEKVESLLAAVQNPSTPVPLIGNKERRRPLDKTKQTKRRKGIYITNEDLPEPVVNGIFCLTDDAPRRRLEDTGVSGSGEIKVCISAADPRDSINSSEARTSSSVFGDKSDDSAANGPPSPCDVPPPPIWPRLETDTRRRRTRLSHQSSDERDDDHFHRTPHRKYGVIFRADSPSEGESESGTSARASSPSPFNPSDVSDVESRDGKRRPVRPVRGPYGKMLDTPTLRSNRSFDERENSRRSFSDATVPHRKTSAGGPPRSTPTHVRATSSPSKLAVMRGAAGGADFLAELLRGSSEALSNSRNFDNVVLCLQQNVNVSKRSF